MDKKTFHKYSENCNKDADILRPDNTTVNGLQRCKEIDRSATDNRLSDSIIHSKEFPLLIIFLRGSARKRNVSLSFFDLFHSLNVHLNSSQASM